MPSRSKLLRRRGHTSSNDREVRYPDIYKSTRLIEPCVERMQAAALSINLRPGFSLKDRQPLITVIRMPRNFPAGGERANSVVM